MSGKATIPIYHGDDFERMAELRREVDIAERKLDAAKKQAEEAASARRAGDDDDAVEDARATLMAAREAFAEFVDEAEPRAEMWVIRPIGHQEFRELLKDHPPRTTMEGEGDDAREVTEDDDLAWASFGISVNTETFPRALMEFVDPDDDEIRTVHEPAFETTAALRKRIKRLSLGEFNSLWIAAYMVNTGAIADPKASPYYDGAQRSAAT